MAELRVRTDGTLIIITAIGDNIPEIIDEIVLRFEDIEDLENGPDIILEDGTVVTVEELMEALATSDIEPAAGPTGTLSGGGVGEYRDDTGSIIDGTDKLDGLDPRDFLTVTVEALDADPLDDILADIPVFELPDDPEEPVDPEDPVITSILTLTNHKLDAGYNNSFGYYIKDEDGNPLVGMVIWDNVKNFLEDTVKIEGYSPEDIGFFIIPDGDRANKWLEAKTLIDFQNVDGQWTAFVEGVKIVGKDANILFDNPSFNEDNYNYLIDNKWPGNLNWEDIAGGGDKDFNDVNITAEWAVLIDGVPQQEFV